MAFINRGGWRKPSYVGMAAPGSHKSMFGKSQHGKSTEAPGIIRKHSSQARILVLIS